MSYQKTISKTVVLEGINVYTGKSTWAKFHPSNPNRGIQFYSGGEKIKAGLENAVHRKKSIFLEGNKKQVGLVEHLLSSVYSLEIDNILIELKDGICPTLESCSKEYFLSLKRNLLIQTSVKKFWKYSSDFPKKVFWENFPDKLVVKPSKEFNLKYYFNYPHLPLRNQEILFKGNLDFYENEISDSRPPGFLGVFAKPFLSLGKLGFHGINESNYLLVGKKSKKNFLNSSNFGVRHEGTEPVRHKIIDVLGTLALTGHSFKNTSFDFHMTGHKFDLFALRKLFSEGFFERVE